MMKKWSVLTLVGLLLMGVSCGKYEDGPGFSLRSKKARVANEWKVEYAYDFEDQVETTTDFAGEVWVLSKDGSYLKMEDGETKKTGTWDFISDKEEIAISFPTDIDKYTILRLKENEMWIKDHEEEIHFVPVD